MGGECYASKMLGRGRVGRFEMEQGVSLCFFPTQPKLLQIRIGQMFSGIGLCSFCARAFLKQCAGNEDTYLLFVHITCRSFLAY